MVHRFIYCIPMLVIGGIEMNVFLRKVVSVDYSCVLVAIFLPLLVLIGLLV